MRWLVLLICAPAMAAPVLRLNNSAALWLSGDNPIQTICSSNAGDGTLALSAAVEDGADWLKVSVDPNQCIRLTFDASGLRNGTYTARVTVSDPQAIDAPQVITATAVVGGGDPVAIDQYVAPGASGVTPVYTGGSGFCPPNCPAFTTSTQDGGGWLAVTLAASATIEFARTAYIHLSPAAAMAEGTYTGSVTFHNYAARTIPVTMRVTTQPIAVPSTPQINLRLAAGGPVASYPFLPATTFTNSGMGTLELQGVSATGEGVSASLQAGQVVVAIDPMSRGPGIYTDGMVTIQCNGANCPVLVPVNLEIVPRAAPTIAFRGVVDNAAYSTTVAPGDVCILKGEQLSGQAPVLAAGFPLPTNLGGATVLVNDVLAPLYYTSVGQIAFQVPYSAVTGTALVQVLRDGAWSNIVTADVVATAPQIAVITDANYQLRDATHPTKAGETLILWAIGLGATNPPVDTGAAAPLNPPAVAVKTPVVSGLYGTIPSFAGLSGGSAGLYQVIVTVPAGLPKGNSYVSLGGNYVDLNVQ